MSSIAYGSGWLVGNAEVNCCAPRFRGWLAGLERVLLHALSLQDPDRKWVKKTLSALSLEEKVGQMLQIRYYGDYNSFDSPEYVSLRDEIRKYHIGSVILYVHSQSTGLIRVSPMEVARVANRLQADSDLPLLMSADIERGVATRLTEVPSFPWPMAFGA